ncbi:hypothetical protein AFCDBAGC_1024 [Methylobacterium cerastii]|uniref:Uncharacterized protein n=1 Tax=Methylobacterium cerastii TaxID=932741 RepID=A0ABQ4QD96_9HYPH|nr:MULTISPECIES: hypothetical protein [Methylobacterium]TXN84398.1 hypothetical protein FV234_02370 [Methylobacterium sp. WL8]GJD43178.1 hypothetical protein AFCDBAGC_1024 [Methylobacterium cerastii]
MRLLLSATLLLAAAPACAGGAEEFFLGRPPSVGVVQGGAFGVGGADYLDESRARRPVSAPRPVRTAHRVVHAQRVRPVDPTAIVARPYFKP